MTLATLVLVAGLAEAGFRLFVADRPPGPVLPGLLVRNPDGTGSYRLKPNLAATSRMGRLNIRIVTNSHGMHWREVPIEKPPGRRRIAFLGDSFTFGQWADRVENAFVGVFEKTLPDATFEVLNFGVGGYGFADMRLQLRETVMEFEPDYVFVIAFNGNDFRDTFLGEHKHRLVDGRAHWDSDVLHTRIPPEYRAQQPVPTGAGRLPHRLRSYRWAVGVFQAWVVERRPPATRFEVSGDFTSYTFWSQRDYPAIARAAVDSSFAALEDMAATARAHGATLLIAALPYREQVYAAAPQGEDYDIRLPQMYLEDFARAHGLPYVDLLPSMREHVSSATEPLYWGNDPHLTPAGHTLVGEILAAFFAECIAGPTAVGGAGGSRCGDAATDVAPPATRPEPNGG